MELLDKNKRNEIYLFTENFPYGLGEAFLNSEMPFLANTFEEVHIIPLWKNGEMRTIPKKIVVEQPLLGFKPKGNPRLVLKGLFCLSPFFFAIPLFFKEKAWKEKKRFWDFMTSFLLIRAAYSSLHIKFDKNALLYSYWGDKLALLLPFLKKKYGVNCIARFHRTDLYEEACGGYKPFRRWLFKDLDVAMPISEDGKRYLLERYGAYAPKHIEVHRLGVFDHGLNPLGDDDVFQIVSCSYIIPVKRVAFLAKAIGKLGFSVRWVHIGDGELRDEVEKEISRFPGHVSGTLLGAMPNSEVLDFYLNHHIDLFVNVSESEGVPVSIMEAFSFGIPVIATNVGGVSEIVDDAVGKLLQADVTEQELLDAILEISNRDKAAIRHNARKRWEDKCDAQRNYSLFCEFLKKAIP